MSKEDAKEWYQKNGYANDEDWDRTGHDDTFTCEVMDAYAKHYHKEQMKIINSD